MDASTLARRIKSVLARITSQQPVDVREFIWLCLPALLAGICLRAHFIWVTPQGYFGADSKSFFHFSHELFSRGEFDLEPKRRWFYPIVLALLTPLPWASWYVVPLVQHILGLCTVLGIGWITMRLSAWPRLTVPLVTLICSVWPRLIWYEHEFIAESFVLAAFVLSVSLALIPGVFQKKRGLFLIFLSMILLAGFKAVGRFFWLGALISIVIYAGNPLRWAWTIRSALAAIMSLVVAVTVGQNSQGYWLLLNSVLPLVQEQGEPHNRYRQALRPLITQARKHGNNYPWHKYKYKKMLKDRDPNVIHPDWANLIRDDRKFAEVAKSLSYQAIRENPSQFFEYTVSSFAIASKRGGVIPRFDPPIFWKDQLLSIERIRKDPGYINYALRVNQKELEQLADQGRRKKYAFLEFHHWFDKLLRPLYQPDNLEGLGTLVVRPFGWLVGLGIAISLRPSLIRRAALLLVPCFVYSMAVYAVGDAVPRYLHPIEWVGFIFGVLAIETLLRIAVHAIRKLQGPDSSETKIPLT